VQSIGKPLPDKKFSSHCDLADKVLYFNMIHDNSQDATASKKTSKLPDDSRDSAEYAARLRHRREELRISQKKLGTLTKVSTTTIQCYESGQYPKGDHAIALARALSCSLDWLLLGDERGQPPAVEAAAACGMCSEMLRQLGTASERLHAAAKIERELRKEIGALNMENATLESQIDDLQHQLSLSANTEQERPQQKTA